MRVSSLLRPEATICILEGATIRCIMIMLTAIAAAFVTAVTAQASPPAAKAEIAKPRQALIPGTWSGDFFQRKWTFEIIADGSGYSGRYRRSDGRAWLPLKQLKVSGRKVSFSIESTPKISFDLQGDSSNQDMSGTVTLEGYATLPFSAARVS